MLQLFFAAGAIMFPTVFGAGLAIARRGWHKVARAACLVIAAGPVLFVGADLVHKFGWSIQTAVGFTAMLAIYSVIIWATRFALAPQAEAGGSETGRNLPRPAGNPRAAVPG